MATTRNEGESKGSSEKSREKFFEENSDALLDYFRTISSLTKAFSNNNWPHQCQKAARSIVEMLDNQDPLVKDLVAIYYKVALPCREKIELEKPSEQRNKQYGKPGVIFLEDGSYEASDEVIFMSETVQPKGKYASQYQPLKEHLQNLERQSTLSTDIELIQYRGKLCTLPYKATEIAIFGKILDEKNQEQRICYSSTILVESEEQYFENIREFIESVHMRRTECVKALNYANKFYQKIKDWKKGNNQSELISNMGSLAWHLAHIMPGLLGSAGATEILLSALMQSKEIVPVRLTQDIAWDFEAFVSDENSFVDKVCQLYKVKPILTDMSKPFTSPLENKRPEEHHDAKIELSEASYIFRGDVARTVPNFLLRNKGITDPAERYPFVGREKWERIAMNCLGKNELMRRYAKYDKQWKEVFKEHTKQFPILNKPNVFRFLFNYKDELYCAPDKINIESMMKDLQEKERHNLFDTYNKFLDLYNRSRIVYDWIETLSYSKRNEIYEMVKLDCNSLTEDSLKTIEEIMKQSSVKASKVGMFGGAVKSDEIPKEEHKNKM